MNVEALDTSRYRYERKFIISELTRHEIEAVVKLHPAMFLEIYSPRYINNIYFDTPEMGNYFDNVDGLKDRAKPRIRWYGDLFGFIEKPVLEIKTKNNLVGKKESFPLLPFSINADLQLDAIREVFKKSNLPDALRLNLTGLECFLLNRYRRQYFQSADRRYRLTIDSEMVCYQIQPYSNTFLHKSVDFVNTVVELKYNPGENQSVDQITNHFPFRMTKNSKYVTGIERLYSW